MKKTAKLTSKGQITVPHEIRRALGVQPGDKLVFEKKDGNVIQVTPERARDPFEKFRGIENPGIPKGRKGVIRWMRKMRGH